VLDVQQTAGLIKEVKAWSLQSIPRMLVFEQTHFSISQTAFTIHIIYNTGLTVGVI